MKRAFGLALVGLLLALPSAFSADGVLPGNWRMAIFSPMGNSESTPFLVKVDTKNGKSTATLVSPASNKAEVVNFDVKGDYVRLVVKLPNEMTFQGRLSKDGKKISGVYGNDQAVTAAYMTPTEMTALDAKDKTRNLGIDALDKLDEITRANNAMVAKIQQTKDDEERKKLIAEFTDANKKSQPEIAKLHREAVDKHANTYAGGRSALTLLRSNGTATPEEMKRWAEIASKAANEFGPIFSAETNSQIASIFVTRKKSELALEFANAAEKALDDKCSADLQQKVLEALLGAHKLNGSKAEIAAINTRLEKLDKLLDAEYLAKVPSFKGTKFPGRKAQSERVVLMELFTGAQCPPCVAADVAFDVLQKTYKSSDLVLLQYHMHIPGPDPMTNPDTEARWKYYTNAFPKQVGGVPSSMFNGTPKSGGGGGMAAAESKYEAYRAIIDPLLEVPTSCKITASAKRLGDKVQIQTNVAGLEKPGKEMKLRIVLVEETIPFAGSNRVRFHHQVVRAMPGGTDGIAVMNPVFSVNNEVDLKDLRTGLNSYLDDYAANKRAFPQARRPLDFQNLRVIAFLQNDDTHEILQAVQTDVIQ